MKLRSALLLGILTVSCFAQEKVIAKFSPQTKQTAPASAPSVQEAAKPAGAEPTVAELKRELAIQKVKTAIAEAQTAEANIAVATKAATDAARQKDNDAYALIKSTQQDLGLDERYEWNMQAMNYVMKPQVGQPPKR